MQARAVSALTYRINPHEDITTSLPVRHRLAFIDGSYLDLCSDFRYIEYTNPGDLKKVPPYAVVGKVGKSVPLSGLYARHVVGECVIDYFRDKYALFHTGIIVVHKDHKALKLLASSYPGSGTSTTARFLKDHACRSDGFTVYTGDIGRH